MWNKVQCNVCLAVELFNGQSNLADNESFTNTLKISQPLNAKKPHPDKRGTAYHESASDQRLDSWALTRSSNEPSGEP